jgi:hypothetical protein
LEFKIPTRNPSTTGTNQRRLLYNRHYPKLAAPSPVAPTNYPIVKDYEWLPPPSSPAARWSRFRGHFRMSRHSGKRLRKPGTEEEWDRKDIGSITRSSTKSAKYSITYALKSLARIPTRMSSRVEWTKKYKPPPGVKDDSRDVLDFGSGSRKSGSRLRSFLSSHNPFKSTPKTREANMPPKEFLGPFPPKIPVTSQTNAPSEIGSPTLERALSFVPSWQAGSPSQDLVGRQDSLRGTTSQSSHGPMRRPLNYGVLASRTDIGRPSSMTEVKSPSLEIRASPSPVVAPSIHHRPVSTLASTLSARSSFEPDQHRQSTRASSRQSETPASSIYEDRPGEQAVPSRVPTPISINVSPRVTRDMSYLTYSRHPPGAQMIHIPPKRKAVGSATTVPPKSEQGHGIRSRSTAPRARSGTGDSGYVSQESTRKSTAPSLPELSFPHDSTWPPLPPKGTAV